MLLQGEWGMVKKMTVVLMGWGQTHGNYCHGGHTTVDLMLPLFVVFK